MSVHAAPAPRARLRALDRWVVPSRFRRWTDAAPERYWLGLPLVPPVLLTCSPEDARVMFTEREGKLQFGQGLKRLSPHMPLFGPEALSRLDGEDHIELRRQLTAGMHGDALKGYTEHITSLTHQHMDRWPLGRPVRFADLAGDLVRDIICAAIFGVASPARTARLQAALNRLEAAIDSKEMVARMLLAVILRGRWAPYPSTRRALAEMEEVTREEIAERRATGRTDDSCLGRFLADGANSDADIVTAMRVLVVAGWATSSNTVAWLIERLAHNPEALARCHEDVDSGDGRYLGAAVQETLRIRPAVPFTMRYVSEDFDLNGLMLKAGTLLAVDIERMHFRPDIYPEPNRFKPERFYEQRPGTYAWLPFGGGHHRCIGAGFALTEARLILTEMLQRMTLAPETRGERSKRTVLITAPARGATVTLLPR